MSGEKKQGEGLAPFMEYTHLIVSPVLAKFLKEFYPNQAFELIDEEEVKCDGLLLRLRKVFSALGKK